MGKRARIFLKTAPKAKNMGHGSYKAKRHPGSKVNKNKK